MQQIPAWGEKKAQIISKAVESDVSHLIPAPFLQNHPNATLIIDEPAASDLKRIKTPWLVGDCEWTEKLTIKAVCWLSEHLSKAVLKVTDEDYN